MTRGSLISVSGTFPPKASLGGNLGTPRFCRVLTEQLLKFVVPLLDIFIFCLLLLLLFFE